MKFKTLLAPTAMLAMMIGLTGCTEQARDKYGQAGESVERAAEKTGDAVSTDAKVAGEAVRDTAQNAQQAADDAQMTTQIKSALLAAEDLETRNINVETKEGQVRLTGSVPNDAMKQRAETLAKGVAGQKYQVRNELTVGADTRPGDEGTNNASGR